MTNGSQATETFVLLVREYCDWVEAGDYSDLSCLYMHLAKLQVGVLQMPHTEPDDNGDSDEVIPSDLYQSVRSKLDAGLGLDLYWEMCEPLDMNDKSPGCGSLRGDIAEIWSDLKECLLNYEAGRTKNAVFDWKLLFETHWGRHLTSALRVLQSHLF